MSNRLYANINTNPYMDQIVPILWTLLGVGLMIAEVFTLGFVLFWFGIGAIAAAIAAFLGAGIGLQFLTFAIVSIALTALSRTIFLRYLPTAGDAIKTGVDALPGKIGTVTGTSKGALNESAVKVYGTTWTAYPIDEVALTEGEKVEVVEVRGSSIYVRRMRDELPEWRSQN
jgi:membrane protein implicated in regulation of membrane protease activity